MSDFLRLESLDKRFGSARRHARRHARGGARARSSPCSGPPGSGKTTILRLTAGFETPDAGRIVVEGEDVTALPPERRRFGMVFQHYALFPHMTVGENVAFGLDSGRASRAAAVRARRGGPRPDGPRGLREAPRDGDLRRPAAARGARPRPRALAAGPAPRRAALEPRPGAAREDAPGAQARDPADRHHDALRDARAGGGLRARRPRRRPERGPPRADRHAGGALRAAGDPFRRDVHRPLERDSGAVGNGRADPEGPGVAGDRRTRRSGRAPTPTSSCARRPSSSRRGRAPTRSRARSPSGGSRGARPTSWSRRRRPARSRSSRRRTPPAKATASSSSRRREGRCRASSRESRDPPPRRVARRRTPRPPLLAGGLSPPPHVPRGPRRAPLHARPLRRVRAPAGRVAGALGEPLDLASDGRLLGGDRRAARLSLRTRRVSGPPRPRRARRAAGGAAAARRRDRLPLPLRRKRLRLAGRSGGAAARAPALAPRRARRDPPRPRVLDVRLLLSLHSRAGSRAWTRRTSKPPRASAPAAGAPPGA